MGKVRTPPLHSSITEETADLTDRLPALPQSKLLEKVDKKDSQSTTLSQYIAKHKVVFKGKRPLRQSLHASKKTAWKLAPEFVYMIDGYFSCIIAVFQIFLAVSLITWRESIQSILEDTSTLQKFTTLYKNLSMDKKRNLAEAFEINRYYLYRSGFLSSHSLGAVMIFCSWISIINTIIGWKAAMLALRRTLIIHRYFDVPIVVINVAAITWGFLLTNCILEMDIIERSLLENFMNYGDAGRSDSLINRIQQSLGCCGIHGPMDYFDSNVRLNVPDESSFGKLPSSCCREWWIRNTECGSKSQRWIKPGSTIEERILFTETIQQVGCTERIYEVCSLLISLFIIGMCVSFLLYLLHIVIRYFTVVQMLREESAIRVKESQEVKTQGRLGFPLWSAGNSLQSSGEEDVDWSKAPQEIDAQMKALVGEELAVKKAKKKFKINQDVIQHYKDRAHFAEIESKLAQSYLGKWVEEARDTTEYSTERIYASSDEAEEIPPPPKPNMPPPRATIVHESPLPPPPPKEERKKKKKKKRRKKVTTTTIIYEVKPEPEPVPKREPQQSTKDKKKKKSKDLGPYSHVIDYNHFDRMKRKLLKDREKREKELKEQQEREQKEKQKLAEIEQLTKEMEMDAAKPKKKRKRKRKSSAGKPKAVVDKTKKLQPFHQRYPLRKVQRKKSFKENNPFPAWLG